MPRSKPNKKRKFYGNIFVLGATEEQEGAARPTTQQQQNTNEGASCSSAKKLKLSKNVVPHADDVTT